MNSRKELLLIPKAELKFDMGDGRMNALSSNPCDQFPINRGIAPTIKKDEAFFI